MDSTGLSAGMVFYGIDILCSMHVSEPTNNIAKCMYLRHTHSSLLYWTLDTLVFSILQGDKYAHQTTHTGMCAVHQTIVKICI